jgi:Response regulators consisting of a CheY-like receiver domain and a winged-helix DNA-binding domain
VDVHVRRLRAKLGVEHEALIGTVRNVGYRFVTPDKRGSAGSGANAGSSAVGSSSTAPGSSSAGGSGSASSSGSADSRAADPEPARTVVG